MSIQANCAECKKIVSAPEKYAGREAKCPGCGGRVLFPTLKDKLQTGSSSATVPNSLNETTDRLNRIPCPYCAELIVSAARKCRFCGEFLDESNQITSHDSPPPIQPGSKQNTTSNTEADPKPSKVNGSSIGEGTRPTFPIWRVVITLVLVGIQVSLHMSLVGFLAGLIVVLYQLILLLPFIFISWKLCLFRGRVVLVSPVGWGAFFLIVAFFKVFAPFDGLYLLVWC